MSPFSECPGVGIRHLLSSESLLFRVVVLKTYRCCLGSVCECVILSASLSCGAHTLGQRPGAVLGGPADPSAVLETWGGQLGPVFCPFSPLLSWRLPASCGAVQVMRCPCVALARHLLAHGEQDPAVPSCRQPGAGVATQEEVCGCLSSCISGCGEILGKNEILTGLEETSSVCGNRNCAPNQGGKQNPRPNQKAFPVFPASSSSSCQGRAEGPQLPCLG